MCNSNRSQTASCQAEHDLLSAEYVKVVEHYKGRDLFDTVRTHSAL